MRRVIIMLVGLPVLVVGVVLLWVAFGPQAAAERTTGGVLYTQQVIAAQGGANELGAVVDGETLEGPLAPVPMAVEISSDAQNDLATVDEGEILAAPMVIEMAADAGLTSDVVLSPETEIELAPLADVASDAPDGQGGQLATPTKYEQRVVELEWPERFQVGRASLVRVKLKVLADGSLQPVAEIDSNEVLATPILITDRYDDYTAQVLASISALDFAVDSTSPKIQVMERGGEVEWRWTLKADDTLDNSVITLGLSLSWVPKTEGLLPAPQNVPIWGQALQVDVDQVFGLITVPQASILGTALAVLGLIAQFPLLEKLLEGLLDALFNRKKDDDKDRKRRRS